MLETTRPSPVWPISASLAHPLSRNGGTLARLCAPRSPRKLTKPDPCASPFRVWLAAAAWHRSLRHVQRRSGHMKGRSRDRRETAHLSPGHLPAGAPIMPSARSKAWRGSDRCHPRMWGRRKSPHDVVIRTIILGSPRLLLGSYNNSVEMTP